MTYKPCPVGYSHPTDQFSGNHDFCKEHTPIAIPNDGLLMPIEKTDAERQHPECAICHRVYIDGKWHGTTRSLPGWNPVYPPADEVLRSRKQS